MIEIAEDLREEYAKATELTYAGDADELYPIPVMHDVKTARLIERASAAEARVKYLSQRYEQVISEISSERLALREENASLKSAIHAYQIRPEHANCATYRENDTEQDGRCGACSLAARAQKGESDGK